MDGFIGRVPWPTEGDDQSGPIERPSDHIEGYADKGVGAVSNGSA